MGAFNVTLLRAFRCNKCLVALHRRIITRAMKVRLTGEEVWIRKLQKWLLKRCVCGAHAARRYCGSARYFTWRGRNTPLSYSPSALAGSCVSSTRA